MIKTLTVVHQPVTFVSSVLRFNSSDVTLWLCRYVKGFSQDVDTKKLTSLFSVGCHTLKGLLPRCMWDHKLLGEDTLCLQLFL